MLRALALATAKPLVTRYSSQMIFKELLSIAEAGDAEAQYKVGVIYENGQGVEDNFMGAARWYQL
jgi:TPR repeat protein